MQAWMEGTAGRWVLLGDAKTQQYTLGLCSARLPIASSMVTAAATGILMAYIQSLLYLSTESTSPF